MRGGATILDASGVNCAFSSSFTPRANGSPTTRTFSRISRSKGGTLTTNSPVSTMLR
jgi:hypothetical protein